MERVLEIFGERCDIDELEHRVKALDEKEREGAKSYTTGRLTVEDDPLGFLDIRVVKKDDEE